ncbi:unnamed protein product [Merluccius merluccius]
MPAQRSSASWDAGGAAEEEERGAEKPEPESGSQARANGSSPGEGGPLAPHESPVQRPAVKSPRSVNREPVLLRVPVQQNPHRDRDAMSLQGPSQLSMGGPRACSTPWTVAHLNGDPLSVFDDSTLSDLSDSEGRSPSACRRLDENMMGGEMELAEDLDELTQSSDTPTDDIESPASGYRHASMLIQKLDSTVLDSSSMVKLQNIFHEYENSIQKARGRHGHLSHKVSQLEGERRELSGTLEDLREAKSALERQQLELQTEVDNLRFKLKQEQENRRNASMLYDTGRDKLRRAEEHQQTEVEERQKVELALRSLELERRTLLNNMKQLEEDLSETQRLLAQERTARALQENLLSSHLRKQQEIEEESRRSVSRSNEALSQLTEASDREKALVQQTASMHEELAALRTELEHGRSAAAQEESRRAEEREALEERLEDARRDLRLNEEALTQTVFQYNGQLGALKTELSAGAARLEHERQAREVLEAELESARTRLAGALQEAERCQAARADTEKNLLRERDEHQRLRDKTTSEAAGQRDAVGGLSQRLAKAETRANGLENEVHRAALQLTEKSLLLDAGQRERDTVATRCRELEEALRAEKELATRSSARLEATQERLAQVQSDAALLRQQLEEAQNKGVAKERAVTDAQERFGDLVSQLRADGEGRVQMAEDRSRELAGKAGDLRDQVYKLEEEKTERESTVRQLQQELADSLKKLSMSEASLEVNTRYRNDLEEEKARLSKDQDRLRGKLDESEDQYVQAERRLSALKATLDDRERQLATADQKLREALSTSAGSDTTIKQLEEAVQRLEIENARLEAAAKQQANKIEALQKGAHEATVVRGRLEDLVTDLQGSKMTLEDQLNREVQRQSLLSHTAQDSQALWEEELKSRSKLGVRLAELEKERGDLGTQMETEKKKAKKMAEQKKAVDSRLDQEMKRNTDLQKEMYRLRTLLKTAKKKLREQDGGSPMGSQRMDTLRHSMRDKVCVTHTPTHAHILTCIIGQLEREASRCRQLETANADLTERLASTQGLSRANQRLEEQLAELRRRRAQEEDAGLADPGQAERYRRDAEERASLQIRQKLEEVNLFLQNQAASQEALDQIKSANEANLRSQLEQRIRELEGEVGRARSGQQDSLNLRESTRSELERYRELYTDELRLRKSLAAKLDRANDRLAEANAKLMSERHRSKSLIAASSLANGSLGGSALDLGALGSLPAYGASLGPLSRSLGLGLGGSPLGDRQGGRVEEYLAKMQSELERNISKELNHATVELAGGGSARLSPVGSASAADLRDQASRAQQQYLAVLKKNNMI